MSSFQWVELKLNWLLIDWTDHNIELIENKNMFNETVDYYLIK